MYAQMTVSFFEKHIGTITQTSIHVLFVMQIALVQTAYLFVSMFTICLGRVEKECSRTKRCLNFFRGIVHSVRVV